VSDMLGQCAVVVRNVSQAHMLGCNH
jgi:hypothetical protein